MKRKSILTREALDLFENIKQTRLEYGSDHSEKPEVNAAEYALNDFMTLLVLQLEKAQKLVKGA